MLRVALSRIVEAGGQKRRRSGRRWRWPCTWACCKPEEDSEVTAGGEHVLLEAIYDPKQPGSLAGNIRNLMWSATHVRERLSLDHWHSLNRLQREQQAAQKNIPRCPRPSFSLIACSACPRR